jgi:hypothetical protein
MNYWEIVAGTLSKAGWAASQRLIPNGRTIWIAGAHRGDGKRFVVRADEMLNAFVELETVIRTSGATEASV